MILFFGVYNDDRICQNKYVHTYRMHLVDRRQYGIQPFMLTMIQLELI